MENVAPVTTRDPLLRKVLAVASRDGWGAVPRRIGRSLLHMAYAANAATWFER